MVLVLGDGLLGSEIVKQSHWDVASRKLGTLDINDYEGLTKLVENYDTIINCIANTDSYSSSKKEHWDTNYKFVTVISNLCQAKNKKLVHISTEFVYANNDTPPTEEEIPKPDDTWYAYTKLLADEYIKITNTNYLICRELHKPNPFPYSQVWDVQTSGDSVEKIASLIIKLVEKQATGVFNVGTGDKFLDALAPFSVKIPAPSHVPKDTRMNLDKLNKFLNL